MAGTAEKLKTRDRLKLTRMPEYLRTLGSHNDGGSLYFVVRRKGSGAWVFKFRDGRRLRSKGLGAYPAISLAEARRKRDAARAGHAAEPEQPKSAGLPLENLAERYFEHHATDFGAPQLKRNRALLRLHASPLMRLRANKITREQVADVLRPIWLGSSNSKGIKVRALLERILNSADNERNPATLKRLESLLPARPKRVARSVSVASLPYAQLPEVWRELSDVDRDPGLMAACALRFIILTSVRLKEARGARWEEIQFKAKLWRIPARRMKIKDEDFEVPLSDEAIALLREVRRKSNSDFVFPGRWSDHCIGRNAIFLAVGRLDRLDERGRAITTHGFRSTFATWAQEQRPDGSRQFDQETIEGCLAHFVSGLPGKYQRSKHLEARRALMNAWGKFATEFCR